MIRIILHYIYMIYFFSFYLFLFSLQVNFLSKLRRYCFPFRMILTHFHPAHQQIMVYISKKKKENKKGEEK